MTNRSAKASRRSHIQSLEMQDPVADLVCFGFRGWMLGRQTADIAVWEAVWRRYASLLGTIQARCIVSELETWTRQINRSACRAINVECLNCPNRTTDETLAVSIIAAAQHEACPAMRACAFAMLNSSNIDPMLERAETVAEALKQSDQVLAPWSVSKAEPHSPLHRTLLH